MRLFYPVGTLLIGLLIASPSFADQNATGGGVVNSETISLGTGPFDHAAGIGDSGNSVVTASFVGGFTANQVRFSGTLAPVIAATWGSEADIQITAPLPPPPAEDGLSTIWQNPGPNSAFTSFDYDVSSDITSVFAGGVDPNGTWTIEFFDTFDDGAGADSQSSNVFMTFEEAVPVSDFDGVFSLGTLSDGTVTSVGEFALANLFDSYSLTLTTAGVLDIFTEADVTGFTGFDVDTEIGIFDGAGLLLDNDDDGGDGTFSALLGMELAAGDYTIVVGGFNTSFADGPTIGAGAGTGDYGLNVSFTAVPEPSSMALIGVAFCGLAFRRRRS